MRRLKIKRNQQLIINYKAILSYTGLIYLLVSLLLILPLSVLMEWPEELKISYGFIIPTVLLAGIGLSLWQGFKLKEPAVLNVQEGSIIVLFSWIFTCIFSAFPFMLLLNFNFTQAIFESVSGWTTTGLSVVDVTTAPKAILLWRSLMQFGGGAGLVIIMLAAIVGPGGPGLSIAEGRTDQLVPNVRQSAKLVFTLYSAYIIIGIIAYYLAGMTFFDAINHAIPAVSTGGFSTRVESIGYWNSATIEAITIVLMIFGTLNFLTSYTLLRGKLSAFAKNGEVRLMVVLIPIFFFILLLFVCQNLYPTLEKSIRVAIFEPVSALSTTGFSTVPYNNWKSIGIFSLIILMLIGGGTCSTAGGIKQYRIYLLYKSIIWEIKRLLLPRNSIQENFIWQGDQKVYINDGTLRTIVAFVSLYMITYFTGSGILMLHGYSIGDSMFEFASSLGTVGLSIGVTNLSAPALVLWTETIGMFLGRLEFFAIFIGFFKLIKDSFIMLKN